MNGLFGTIGKKRITFYDYVQEIETTLTSIDGQLTTTKRISRNNRECLSVDLKNLQIISNFRFINL